MVQYNERQTYELWPQSGYLQPLCGLGPSSHIGVIKMQDLPTLQSHQCIDCSEEILPQYYHYELSNEDWLCPRCAFVRNLVSEKFILEAYGIYIDGYNVFHKDGQIYITKSKLPPWKKSIDEIRRSPEYSRWRDKVLNRYNHTCANCGAKDNLEVHHIKPVAEYPDLILEVDNGKVLCESCHKKEHGWGS